MAEHGPAGPTVVLVDDDARNLAALQETLEQRGIDVVGHAQDGVTGVQLALDLRPDVVLMDLRMPGVDGFEATRQIQAASVGVEVIILTAYEELLTKPAHEVGAFAYLVKGCAPDLVRDVIVQAWRHAIEIRRAHAR